MFFKYTMFVLGIITIVGVLANNLEHKNDNETKSEVVMEMSLEEIVKSAKGVGVSKEEIVKSAKGVGVSKEEIVKPESTKELSMKEIEEIVKSVKVVEVNKAKTEKTTYTNQEIDEALRSGEMTREDFEDDCLLIKGNVSHKTGSKIYHMPWGEFYDKTLIRDSEGDQIFCTEEEARRAGFRRSKQ